MSGLRDDGGCHMWELLSFFSLVSGSDSFMVLTTWTLYRRSNSKQVAVYGTLPGEEGQLLEGTSFTQHQAG